MRLLYTALALLLAGSASAATITVTTLDDKDGDDGLCSLREAVASANTDTAVDACAAGDGADTIVFALGGTLTLKTAGPSVTSDVTLDGSTSGAVTLSGGDDVRILSVVRGTLRLETLTLADGLAAAGGAVFVAKDGALVTDGVLFTGNRATGDDADQGGGAVFSDEGAVTLRDTDFAGNAATGASGSGGAVLTIDAPLAVVGGRFANNAARRAGGAIEVRSGTLAVTGAVFEDNVAAANPGNGGAIHLSADADATITGGRFARNRAATEGGAVWNSVGDMTVTGATFDANVAEGDAATNGGGALFNNGGRLVAVDLVVTKNVASGAAGSGGGIMTVGGSLRVIGGTIAGNEANRAGAGVESAGASTVLDGVLVTDNRIATANPGNGGGVHAGGGSLTVLAGTYTNNVATEGGAVWASGALAITSKDGVRPTLRQNTATGDDASNGGGGVYVESGGVATISETDVLQNAATGVSGSGGGLFVADGASATLTDVMVAENRANRAGAGVENAGGTVTLVLSDLRDNDIPRETANPGNGGGLHSGGGTVTILGSLITDNDATEGGGVWTSGTLTVASKSSSEPTVFASNTGFGDDATNGGGAVYAESGADVTITDAVLTFNLATGEAGSGGALFVADGATVETVRGAYTSNRANRAGGGIEVADDADTDAPTTLTVSTLTLADNSIEFANPGNGGGLHIGGAGVVTVDASTVSGNAATEGAGIWVSAVGALDLTNSTVSGNAASGDGGGVYDDGGATIRLESVTVAENTSGTKGGGLLSQTADRFSLTNSALADNAAPAGPDCFGTFVSGGGNAVSDMADCTFVAPGGRMAASAAAVVTGDLRLGPLADNGGSTRTHAPMPGSPLLGATASALATDQRGVARMGRADDIGAVESDALATADDDAPTTGTLSLAVQPNPVRGRAALAITVAEAGPVRVEVYNALGQRVLTAFDGTASPGATVTADLDAAGLASGVYLVRLVTEAGQATQRVTVVR